MENKNEEYPCPCCGFLTRSEPDYGTFEICPICNWEDDAVQFNKPDFKGGANQESLIEAKKTTKSLVLPPINIYMRNVIEEKIHEIEQTHAIRILFACESGSRAWGFPSPDSDYDVRFIYAHQKEWYISVHEKRDVVELMVNKELDINGWDLRKALRLLCKHNAVLLEWVQSPIVYRAKPEFLKGFNEIVPTCFSPISVLHHYLSSAKKYYEECYSADVIKLKKFFYCLRTTLAGMWIVAHKTIPPMELNKLLPVMGEKQVLVNKIQALVQLKATKAESYFNPRDVELEEFLKEGIALCEKVAPSLPSSSPDGEVLNAFLRNMIAG